MEELGVLYLAASICCSSTNLGYYKEELINREETFKYREETFKQLEEAWREESRRQDHIIAALTQRIPQLEASSDEQESAVSDSEIVAKGSCTPRCSRGANQAIILAQTLRRLAPRDIT